MFQFEILMSFFSSGSATFDKMLDTLKHTDLSNALSNCTASSFILLLLSILSSQKVEALNVYLVLIFVSMTICSY